MVFLPHTFFFEENGYEAHKLVCPFYLYPKRIHSHVEKGENAKKT